MVREFKAIPRVYEFPFELVMEAYHLRFPTCPMIPELLSTEIVYDYISEDKSIHITERRYKMNIEAPYILKKIAGIDYAYVIARNTLNRFERTLLIECRNESFKSRVSCLETCTYSVDPKNPNFTVFNQEACLDVTSFFGFESLFEKVIIKVYSKTVEKSKAIMLRFIDELTKKGITHVPVFQPVPGVDYSKSKASIDSIVKQNPLSSANSFTGLGDIINSPNCDESVADISDDYAAPYLGDISLIERNEILQLNKKFKARQDEIPNIACILRFLRANKLNLDKTYETLVKNLTWRRKNHVENIRSWSLPKDIQPYYNGYWNHNDLEGCPLYVIRIGQMDIKGFMKTIGPDGFAKHIIKICEEGLTLCAEATKNLKSLKLSWSILMDLEDLTLKYAWKPILQVVLRLIEVLEANYPESLSKIIVTRAPRVFTIIWSFISAIISDDTKKKLIIISDQCFIEKALNKYIPAECIPDFIVNPSIDSSTANDKLTIPKNLYVYKDSIHSDFIGSISMEDMYKRITITKSYQVEIPVNMSHDEGLITWDFDVLEGDVNFCLCKEGKVGSITSMVNLVLSTRSMEPVEGISQQFYKEGSSVQGSYYCTSSGNYFFIWKLDPEASKAKKANLIYYYDILPSNQLRSSFSSLASSLSNASALDNFSLSSKTHHPACPGQNLNI